MFVNVKRMKDPDKHLWFKHKPGHKIQRVKFVGTLFRFSRFTVFTVIPFYSFSELFAMEPLSMSR